MRDGKPRSVRGRRSVDLPGLADPRIARLAAGLAVLLTLPALSLGLVQDDLTLYTLAVGWPGDPLGPRPPWDLFRFYADADLVHRMRDQGLAPWWTSLELRLAFFRPFSSLWHWLDFRLFGTTAWPHHAVSIAAYGLAALTVGWTFRRLEPDARTAGLATLLWAIDDAHGMPVGWLANRNAITAWGLGALALGLHDRWRRDGWRPGAVLAPLAAALALCAGEAALGAWAYLLAYALFVDRAPLAGRLASIAPYGLVFGAWRAVYRIGGYGTAGSAFYVDPGSDPVAFLGVLPARVATLLSAQLGPVPADLLMVLTGPGLGVFAVLVAASVILAALILVPVVRADVRARFWAFGMVVACVPVAATWPSERLLGFVGLGGFALVARVLLSARPRAVRVPLWIVHVGLAALLLPVRSVMIAGPDAQQRAAADSIPPLEGRELVVVVAPDWFVPTFGALRYTIRGGSEGPALRVLGTTTGPFAAVRIDPHTLVLSAPDGFQRDALAKLVRDRPLAPGAHVEVDGWRIDVLETDGDGHPTRVSFASETPLDDPRRVWTTWDGAALIPWELP